MAFKGLFSPAVLKGVDSMSELVFSRPAGENAEARVKHMTFTQVHGESDTAYAAAMQQYIDDWKAAGWSLQPGAQTSFVKPIAPNRPAYKPGKATIYLPDSPDVTFFQAPDEIWEDFADRVNAVFKTYQEQGSVVSVEWTDGFGACQFSGHGIKTPEPRTAYATRLTAKEMCFDYGNAWQTPTPDEGAPYTAKLTDVLRQSAACHGDSGSDVPDFGYPGKSMMENAGIPSDRDELVEDGDLTWTGTDEKVAVDLEASSQDELESLMRSLNYTDRYRGRGLGEKYVRVPAALGAGYEPGPWDYSGLGLQAEVNRRLDEHNIYSGAQSGRFQCDTPNFEELPKKTVLVPPGSRVADIRETTGVHTTAQDSWVRTIRKLLANPTFVAALAQAGFKPNPDWSGSNPDHVKFTHLDGEDGWPEKPKERLRDTEGWSVGRNVYVPQECNYYTVKNTQSANWFRRLVRRVTGQEEIARLKDEIVRLLDVNGKLLSNLGEVKDLREENAKLLFENDATRDARWVAEKSLAAREKELAEAVADHEETKRYFASTKLALDEANRSVADHLNSLEKARFLIDQAPLIDTTDIDVKRLLCSVTKFAYMNPMTFTNMRGTQQYVNPMIPVKDGQTIRIPRCPTTFVFTTLMPVNRIIYTPNPIPGLPGEKA